MAIPHGKRSRSAEAPSADGRTLPFWPPRDGWIAIAGVVLIYAAHWFYGALISDASMVMGAAAALLAGAVLLTPRLRDDVLRLRGLAAPAVCFLLVLVVGLWTLTPWTPGGPHPIWAFVGATPPASTIDKSATIIELIKLMGLGCLFVVGLATGARDDRARYAVQLCIAFGVLFGLWAFLASVTGSIYQTQGRRLEAHFLNPNTAGTVFAALLLLALAELVRTASGGSRANRFSRATPIAAACLTFAVCLLDSASRGAAVATVIGGLVYIVMQMAAGRLKVSRALLAVVAGLAVLVAVLALAGEQLIDRAFESHEASILRTEIWKYHWRAFLDSPLLGYGLGAAETVNKSLINLSNVDVLWNIRAILNGYLQWLEEAGIVGAAPMFACVGLVIFTTWRGAVRRSRMTGLLAGLLAVDALVLVHTATDFGLEVPSLAGFWAWLLGLQFSLAQGSSRR